MTESQRMARLYDSIYEGDDQGEAWYGIALRPLVKDVTAEQASRTPLIEGHSILQLVAHIAYWEEITLRRFHREVVDAPLNTKQDWEPNRPVTDSEWKAALNRLENSHAALQKAIANCPNEKLNQQVSGKKYDHYVLLHGIIDHAVYHTAQIALVKKSLLSVK
jgi:uncharacterized damage-inducible protein DinB